jgi:hypothetical protein
MSLSLAEDELCYECLPQNFLFPEEIVNLSAICLAAKIIPFAMDLAYSFQVG